MRRHRWDVPRANCVTPAPPRHNAGTKIEYPQDPRLRTQTYPVHARAEPTRPPLRYGLDIAANVLVRRMHPNRLDLIRAPAGIQFRPPPSATVPAPSRRAAHEPRRDLDRVLELWRLRLLLAGARDWDHPGPS